MSYVAAPRWHGEFLPPGAAGLYRSPVGMSRGRAAAFPGRRGLGDVLAPMAADTSLQSSCGLFEFGVFKSACWCAVFPALCAMDSPQGAASAAAGLANPAIYPATVAPYPGAIPNALSTSTAPAGTTLDDFNSAYYAALQAGQNAADATNSAIMSAAGMSRSPFSQV